jgi:hypothetical protein
MAEDTPVTLSDPLSTSVGVDDAAGDGSLPPPASVVVPLTERSPLTLTLPPVPRKRPADVDVPMGD